MAQTPSRTSSTTARPWWLLPTGRVNPYWFIALGGVLVAIDYLTGPNPQAPFLYFFPVALAAWYSGRTPAFILSVVMPLMHFVFIRNLASTLGGAGVLAIQTVLRAVLIGLLGFWLARLAEHERAMDTRVKQLEGLLSICSFCKRIRNQDGGWEALEQFISTRSQAEFSHALCPSCTHRQDRLLFDDGPDQRTSYD
jgi:K+-sensing histidine kinase KdpD